MTTEWILILYLITTPMNSRDIEVVAIDGFYTERD
jgi:hypothetical protein